MYGNWWGREIDKEGEGYGIAFGVCIHESEKEIESDWVLGVYRERLEISG